jgi:integrase
MAKEQSDGRYRSKVIIGHDADGKAVVKYASGRTKKELSENVEELKQTYINGAASDRLDKLYGVYLTDWYNTYKHDKLSASSRANYATAINKHIMPVFGNRQMRAIRSVEIQSFLNTRAGMGKTTLGDIYSILYNTFTRATAEGIIDRNPALGTTRPAAEHKKRRALTGTEVEAVLKIAQESSDGLLLLLLYYTGMRRGEMLGLQWRDVDFEKQVINVCRDMDPATGSLGELKTPSSRRSIPMPPALIKALDAIRGIGTTPVLQSPRDRSHWSHATFIRHWRTIAVELYKVAPSIEHEKVMTKKDAEGNEIPVIGSILTPHYFRHNYASVLYNAGVDVLAAQKILGHADVKTTLSIYAHLGAKKEAESHAAIVSAFDCKK